MPAATEDRKETPTIRIVVSDHRPLIAEALRLLLARNAAFEVLDADREALSRADDRRADIVLLSGAAPATGVLATLSELRERHPRAAPVLLLRSATPSFVLQARAAGVRGMLFEDTPSDHLISALGAVRHGEHVFDPQLAAVNRATRVSLSDRETEVLRLAADGASPHDISRRLEISKSTTRTYLSGAIRKMGATNRLDAAQAARDLGWL